MATVYPPETNDGVVTSWVTLTTVFTPSIGCESKFRLNGPSLVAYDRGYGLDIDPKVKCAPPAVTTWWEQGRLGGGNDAGHTAASLGPMTCPNAWTTVVTSIRGASSTLAMCCPPDYYLANGVSGSVAGDCRSDVPSGAVLTFASTPLGESDAWSIATTTLTGRSIVGAIAVVGWNIALQTSRTSSSPTTSSALSSTTPAPTSSSTSTILAGPTSGAPGVAIGSSSSGESGSLGLPTGAAIGIGVGVGLGVVGIAALLATMYLLRSRKAKAEAAAAAAALSGTQPPPPPPPKPAEAYGPHELGPEVVRPELPDSQQHSFRTYELA
ncbi:hypothetical protein C8A03DRAFT_45525 [Achaetomium macrosporum]|uniref:Uncharacterized protein n=1 Tax=Achaetomium macrosporum TaxID=79813 RepID=A0AAN7HDS2_9PEZI|nr:hypothetical protein C8A03DRAFT_45525 [Achaetomium macrosporum]